MPLEYAWCTERSGLSVEASQKMLSLLLARCGLASGWELASGINCSLLLSPCERISMVTRFTFNKVLLFNLDRIASRYTEMSVIASDDIILTGNTTTTTNLSMSERVLPLISCVASRVPLVVLYACPPTTKCIQSI